VNPNVKFLKNIHFIVFVLVVGLILYEFDQYLEIEINENVILFAIVAGLLGAGVSFQRSHGRIHFGQLLFLIGFVMLLGAGVPLVGNASMGEHDAYWIIGDSTKKATLAVLAFLGLVLIGINFKAYMQNWIFARPLK
jgi:hypothetical protein